jgi:hypothetical protein
LGMGAAVSELSTWELSKMTCTGLKHQAISSSFEG